MKVVRTVPSLALVLVAAGGLSGCGSYQNSAIRSASLDHNCPRESIALTNWQREGSSATAVLDVCGNRRVYRDFGGAQAVVWRDVTP